MPLILPRQGLDPSNPDARAPLLPPSTEDADYEPADESEDDDLPELEDPVVMKEQWIYEVQQAYPRADRAFIEDLLKQMGPQQAGGPPGGSIAQVKTVSQCTSILWACILPRGYSLFPVLWASRDVRKSSFLLTTRRQRISNNSERHFLRSSMSL